MFEFYRGGRVSEWRLVDAGRGLSYKSLGLAGAYTTTVAALLTWGDHNIPLEFNGETRVDPSSGINYELNKLVNFGRSHKIQHDEGIAPYTFESENLEITARLYAVEASLVHRFKMIEGYWDVESSRFMHDGREWRVSDFGYHASTDLKKIRY